MRRVLIFYACYGGGHLSAANAIKDYLSAHAEDIEPIPIDFMPYLSKTIDKITTSAYEDVTKKAPSLWGSFYSKAEHRPLVFISSESTRLMANRLYTLIQEYDPVCIISTHMFSSQMCATLRRAGKLQNVQLATVLTDFAPHDQWLVGSGQIDHFFVAHEEMRQYLVEKGIPAQKVHATGIPISERFFANYNPAEIRDSFGLQEGKFTILFFAGGRMSLCPESTFQILEDICRYLDGVQLVVISGKDVQTFERFCEIVHRYHREDDIKVLDFTNRVPELMHVSDLVISKPGGLTSSESLACGLPMIVINPIPGQEEQNAEYLERNHLAYWIHKTDTPIGVIFKVVKNEHILAQLRQNVQPYSRSFATRKICRVLFPEENFDVLDEKR